MEMTLIKLLKTRGTISNLAVTYGFITTEDHKTVFFHFSIVQKDDLEKLETGIPVVIEVCKTNKGYLAKSIILITTDNIDVYDNCQTSKLDTLVNTEQYQGVAEEDAENIIATIKNISRNWKLEAKLEDKRYFYNMQESELILDAEKFFVIGRKGSGKSAICEHINNKSEYDLFSKKMSFKNFPFNELYKLENRKSYTEPNQYITLWKYLIYSTVCQLMVENENIDNEIRTQLEKIYPSRSKKSLARTINTWVSAEFGVNVLGSGGTLKLQRDVGANDTSWIERVNLLEDIIYKYCGKSKYFIIFDELDEDYRTIKEENSHIAYTNLLTSLFKAAQDIISMFKGEKNIFPVIFLRDDIYSLIKDSDKNKWRDYKVEIEWTEKRLKELLAFRISQDMSNNDIIFPFKKAWGYIFSNERIGVGSKSKNKIDSFKYMSNSTQLRPRDYIRYIQVCAEETSNSSKSNIKISAATTKFADRAFSNYLKDEIIDEIYPILPEIDTIFQIITNIRKPIFSVDEFREEYLRYLDSGTLKEKNIDFVLNTLFNFSIIGNQHKTQSKIVFFKFQQTNMNFNMTERVVLHRGLYKSLQII